jgi:hypothetical protein
VRTTTQRFNVHQLYLGIKLIAPRASPNPRVNWSGKRRPALAKTLTNILPAAEKRLEASTRFVCRLLIGNRHISPTTMKDQTCT